MACNPGWHVTLVSENLVGGLLDLLTPGGLFLKLGKRNISTEVLEGTVIFARKDIPAGMFVKFSQRR